MANWNYYVVLTRGRGEYEERVGVVVTTTAPVQTAAHLKAVDEQLAKSVEWGDRCSRESVPMIVSISQMSAGLNGQGFRVLYVDACFVDVGRAVLAG